MLLLFSLALPVGAQDVQVLSSVDETTIGTEENLVYRIEVRGATLSQVRTPSAPETEGLALLQRFPSTSQQTSIINGRIEQSIGFSWTFRPLREGTAQIKATTVTVGDRAYPTDLIRVTVVPQAQRPQRRATSRRNPFAPRSAEPEPPPEVDDRDLFIRAIPSARDVYQNQQVTVAYQLFFREGIQLRQSRLTDSWDAEGFWREELDVEPRPLPRVVVEDGLRYNMITLKRVAVFPTRSGDLKIDPLRIESEVYVPVRSNDPFDRFFSSRNRYQTVEIASPTVRVTALPLPEDAPPTFNGAVGTFDLSVGVDRQDVEVGGSIQVVVEIEGTGNLATLSTPSFSPPGAFDVYDPQTDTQIRRTGSRVRGTKTFTYVLIPRANGTFELPPIAFTYLNTNTGAYETRRSLPIPVRVSGTAGPLPDTDQIGPFAHMVQNRTRRKVIIENCICALKPIHGFQRQQLGIPRPRSNEADEARHATSFAIR